METENEYLDKAKGFLKRFDLSCTARRADDRCPAWCDGKHIHGNHYRVTISRGGGWPASGCGSGSISFDFWNSHHDMTNGKLPDAYGLLSCVSSESSMPTDPDEVVAEMGDMKPSQAIRVADFAKRLQAFFSEDELEALREIQ